MVQQPRELHISIPLPQLASPIFRAIRTYGLSIQAPSAIRSAVAVMLNKQQTVGTQHCIWWPFALCPTLRYCCLLPKFNFLLKVCNPALIPKALRDLDDMTFAGERTRVQGSGWECCAGRTRTRYAQDGSPHLPP